MESTDCSPECSSPRRPLVPGRVYHFSVIYNHAGCPLSRTEDTDLSLQVTTTLVERLELQGYVNSYFYDRDRWPQNSLAAELERVLAGSSVTVLLLTPGFLRDCLDRYLQMNVFTRFLSHPCPSWRLIVLSVGVQKSQVPAQLSKDHVLCLQEDWEVDGPTWNRFDEAVGDTFRAVSANRHTGHGEEREKKDTGRVCNYANDWQENSMSGTTVKINNSIRDASINLHDVADSDTSTRKYDEFSSQSNNCQFWQSYNRSPETGSHVFLPMEARVSDDLSKRDFSSSSLPSFSKPCLSEPKVYEQQIYLNKSQYLKDPITSDRYSEDGSVQIYRDDIKTAHFCKKKRGCYVRPDPQTRVFQNQPAFLVKQQPLSSRTYTRSLMKKSKTDPKFPYQAIAHDFLSCGDQRAIDLDDKNNTAYGEWLYSAGKQKASDFPHKNSAETVITRTEKYGTSATSRAKDTDISAYPQHVRIKRRKFVSSARDEGQQSYRFLTSAKTAGKCQYRERTCSYHQSNLLEDQVYRTSNTERHERQPLRENEKYEVHITDSDTTTTDKSYDVHSGTIGKSTMKNNRRKISLGPGPYNVDKGLNLAPDVSNSDIFDNLAIRTAVNIGRKSASLNKWTSDSLDKWLSDSLEKWASKNVVEHSSNNLVKRMLNNRWSTKLDDTNEWKSETCDMLTSDNKNSKIPDTRELMASLNMRTSDTPDMGALDNHEKRTPGNRDKRISVNLDYSARTNYPKGAIDEQITQSADKMNVLPEHGARNKSSNSHLQTENNESRISAITSFGENKLLPETLNSDLGLGGLKECTARNDTYKLTVSKYERTLVPDSVNDNRVINQSVPSVDSSHENVDHKLTNACPSASRRHYHPESNVQNAPGRSNTRHFPCDQMSATGLLNKPDDQMSATGLLNKPDDQMSATGLLNKPDDQSKTECNNPLTNPIIVHASEKDAFRSKELMNCPATSSEIKDLHKEGKEENSCHSLCSELNTNHNNKCDKMNDFKTRQTLMQQDILETANTYYPKEALSPLDSQEMLDLDEFQNQLKAQTLEISGCVDSYSTCDSNASKLPDACRVINNEDISSQNLLSHDTNTSCTKLHEVQTETASDASNVWDDDKSYAESQEIPKQYEIDNTVLMTDHQQGPSSLTKREMNKSNIVSESQSDELNTNENTLCDASGHTSVAQHSYLLPSQFHAVTENTNALEIVSENVLDNGEIGITGILPQISALDCTVCDLQEGTQSTQDHVDFDLQVNADLQMNTDLQVNADLQVNPELGVEHSINSHHTITSIETPSTDPCTDSAPDKSSHNYSVTSQSSETDVIFPEHNLDDNKESPRNKHLHEHTYKETQNFDPHRLKEHANENIVALNIVREIVEVKYSAFGISRPESVCRPLDTEVKQTSDKDVILVSDTTSLLNTKMQAYNSNVTQEFLLVPTSNAIMLSSYDGDVTPVANNDTKPAFNALVDDNDIKPVFSALVADNDTKPAFNAPVDDNDIKPVFNAPVADNDMKPVFNAPVADNDTKPVFNAPVADNDIKPVIHAPVADNDTKPVFHAPVADNDMKPDFSADITTGFDNEEAPVYNTKTAPDTVTRDCHDDGAPASDIFPTSVFEIAAAFGSNVTPVPHTAVPPPCVSDFIQISDSGIQLSKCELTPAFDINVNLSSNVNEKSVVRDNNMAPFSDSGVTPDHGIVASESYGGEMTPACISHLLPASEIDTISVSDTYETSFCDTTIDKAYNNGATVSCDTEAASFRDSDIIITNGNIDLIPPEETNVTAPVDIDVIPAEETNEASPPDIDVIPLSNIKVTLSSGTVIAPDNYISFTPDSDAEVAPVCDVNLPSADDVSFTPDSGAKVAPICDVNLPSADDVSFKPDHDIRTTPALDVHIAPFHDINVAPVHDVDSIPPHDVDLTPFYDCVADQTSECNGTQVPGTSVILVSNDNVTPGCDSNISLVCYCNSTSEVDIDLGEASNTCDIRKAESNVIKSAGRNTPITCCIYSTPVSCNLVSSIIDIPNSGSNVTPVSDNHAVICDTCVTPVSDNHAVICDTCVTPVSDNHAVICDTCVTPVSDNHAVICDTCVTPVSDDHAVICDTCVTPVTDNHAVICVTCVTPLRHSNETRLSSSIVTPSYDSYNHVCPYAAQTTLNDKLENAHCYTPQLNTIINMDTVIQDSPKNHCKTKNFQESETTSYGPLASDICSKNTQKDSVAYLNSQESGSIPNLQEGEISALESQIEGPIFDESDVTCFNLLESGQTREDNVLCKSDLVRLNSLENSLSCQNSQDNNTIFVNQNLQVCKTQERDATSPSAQENDVTAPISRENQTTCLKLQEIDITRQNTQQTIVVLDNLLESVSQTPRKHDVAYQNLEQSDTSCHSLGKDDVVDENVHANDITRQNSHECDILEQNTDENDVEYQSPQGTTTCIWDSLKGDATSVTPPSSSIDEADSNGEANFVTQNVNITESRSESKEHKRSSFPRENEESVSSFIHVLDETDSSSSEQVTVKSSAINFDREVTTEDTDDETMTQPENICSGDNIRSQTEQSGLQNKERSTAGEYFISSESHVEYGHVRLEYVGLMNEYENNNAELTPSGAAPYSENEMMLTANTVRETMYDKADKVSKSTDTMTEENRLETAIISLQHAEKANLDDENITGVQTNVHGVQTTRTCETHATGGEATEKNDRENSKLPADMSIHEVQALSECPSQTEPTPTGSTEADSSDMKQPGADSEEEVDWSLEICKGVCHVLSNPDMPYLG